MGEGTVRTVYTNFSYRCLHIPASRTKKKLKAGKPSQTIDFSRVTAVDGLGTN